MSQYSSRIHILVSSPMVWNRFKNNDDGGLGLAELSDTDSNSFIIDGENSYTEEELEHIVSVLASTLDRDGIVIADTTNINVDPYTYCVFMLGDAEIFHSVMFDCDFHPEKSQMYEEVDIHDISNWLNYGDFNISELEEATLFDCGIVRLNGQFIEFSTKLAFPRSIYLRETSFENRPEILEKTFLSEEVYFVHAADKYDPYRLEVMGELGSLGYLPSDVSDNLTPLLLKERLNYTARVVELVRLSQRNKHAKSPIVAISITANISKKKLPLKNSVPPISRDAFVENEKRKQEKREQHLEVEKQRKEAEERERKEAEQHRLKIQMELEKYRQETEERERKEAERRRLVEEKYQLDFTAWSQACEEIKKKRQEMIDNYLAIEKDVLEKEVRQAFESIQAEIIQRRNDSQKRKIDAEEQLKRINLFNFADKKRLREIIKQEELIIFYAENEWKEAQETLQTEPSAIPQIILQKYDLIFKKAIEEFVFPAPSKRQIVVRIC